jgi:hypothetical protein
MGGIHGAMFATTPQLPVGIENPEKITTDKALHIYPNPAANQVSLSFHLNDPAFTYIEVYDLSGRKVLATTPRQKTPGYNTEILNIRHLVKGVYLLKVNMGNGPGLTGKLMIK